MRKFSITGLFAFVMIIALIISVLNYQQRLREKEAELRVARSRVSPISGILGYSEIHDASLWYVLPFSARYDSEGDPRVRIQFPRGGQAKLYYVFSDSLPPKLSDTRALIDVGQFPDIDGSLVLSIKKLSPVDGQLDLKIAWVFEKNLQKLSSHGFLVERPEGRGSIVATRKSEEPGDLDASAFTFRLPFRELTKPEQIFAVRIRHADGEESVLGIWMETLPK